MYTPSLGFLLLKLRSGHHVRVEVFQACWSTLGTHTEIVNLVFGFDFLSQSLCISNAFDTLDPRPAPVVLDLLVNKIGPGCTGRGSYLIKPTLFCDWDRVICQGTKPAPRRCDHHCTRHMWLRSGTWVSGLWASEKLNNIHGTIAYIGLGLESMEAWLQSL